MIPENAIQEWKNVAPWADAAQVEQDLVLTRALIEIYSDPLLSKAFAFRGGTALQKIFFDPATRYSEDIDLVQLNKEPIGTAIDAIRKNLDSWLGEPQRKRKQDRVSLVYRFNSEIVPVRSMRLKIEVNNGEHFTVLKLQTKKVEAQSMWFSGQTQVLTYELEELLGTKLRALYQRKKGRDLFDFSMAFKHYPKIDTAKIVECFQRYMEHEGAKVTRAQFESNLSEKLNDPVFINDISALLSQEAKHEYDAKKEGELIKSKLLSLLPGDPWKGKDRDKQK